MKLLSKDIKKYRDQQLKKQKGICPILGEKIEKGQEVLDHCHKEGYCRKTLDRQANCLEGKIINALRRFIRDESKFVQVLKNLLKYWEADYSNNPIHPKELSPSEKELKALKKRVKKLKTQAGKDKHKPRLDELKAIIKKEKENCWRDE